MLRIIGDPYGYSQKDTGRIQKSPSFNALISAQRKQISYIEKTVAADKHPPGIQPEFHTGTIPDDRDITVQPILPASQPQCSSRNHKKGNKIPFSSINSRFFHQSAARKTIREPVIHAHREFPAETVNSLLVSEAVLFLLWQLLVCLFFLYRLWILLHFL